MAKTIHTVSNSILRGDVAEQKRLARRSFSSSRYQKMEDLEYYSERVFESFMNGSLTLEKKQYGLFAQYIATFGMGCKEMYYDKLQEMADFDVREYVKLENRPFWHKVFGITDEFKAPTAKQMKKSIKKYIYACEVNDVVRADKLRRQARDYVDVFLNDGFALSEEDALLFKKYIRTVLFPVAKGTSEDEAVQKIEAKQYKTISQKEEMNFVQKLKNGLLGLPTMWHNVWANVPHFSMPKMPKWNAPKISIPHFSMPKMPKWKAPKISMPHFSMPKMPKWKAPKISMPHFSMPKMPKWKAPKISMPSFSLSYENKRALVRIGKVLGVTTVVLAGTTFGTRKCANADDNNQLAQNGVELTQQPQKTINSATNADTLTFHFQPVSNLSTPKFQPVAINENIVSHPNPVARDDYKRNIQKAAVKKVDPKEPEPQNPAVQSQTVKKVQTASNNQNLSQASAKQALRQAVINHHEHILSKRLGEKGKQKLYADIENQIAQGIFSLPDSLGKEECAYALAMYRAYGVESILIKARKATQKLTKEENDQLIKDILDAGDTGLGVKAKAEQIHLKMHKGPLSQGHGLYNQMSKKDQKQHLMNLQQWRMAKQQARLAK